MSAMGREEVCGSFSACCFVAGKRSAICHSKQPWPWLCETLNFKNLLNGLFVQGFRHQSCFCSQDASACLFVWMTSCWSLGPDAVTWVMGTNQPYAKLHTTVCTKLSEIWERNFCWYSTLRLMWLTLGKHWRNYHFELMWWKIRHRQMTSLHSEGNISVYTKFHGNSSSRCRDMSLKAQMSVTAL